MIQHKGKLIIDVQSPLNRILKAVVNSDTVYQFSTNTTGRLILNTGDSTAFSFYIQNKLFDNCTINCDSSDCIIENNNLIFNSAGSYDITISYKTVKSTLNILVEDLILQITT